MSSATPSVSNDCPLSVVHDDFHPGNLIIRDAALAGVIDFNRSDDADPYWDFYKIPLLTCYVSRPFARGQVVGYFDGEPDAAFWRRYNLYTATCLHVSLVWCYRNDPEHLTLWRDRVQDILHTHDFVNHGPPDWYLKGRRT